MEKPDYQDIITEYKESVRVLRAQISELEDANKSKDSALKRALQKLEFTTKDLDQANQEINAQKPMVKKTE
jgi:MinD-like ATPase involved in chromosome partitioning or flagellar assembly